MMLFKIFVENENSNFIRYLMQSELKCRACSNPYQKTNVPRLLTMCGHTFCENCISQMISKSSNSQFRIQCPIDKKVLNLPHSKPSFFPKNVSLIKVVELKSQSTIQMPGDNTSFLDIKDSNYLKSSNKTQESLFSQPKSMLFDFRQNDCQTCLLHNKSAEVFCLDDNSLICSTCAIFGNHKGHKFKDISEVQYLSKKTAEDMIAIMQRKRRMISKISNQSLKDDILVVLGKKKQKIHKQIQQCYEKLFQKVKQAKKKKIQQLDELHSKISENISELLSFDEQMMRQYHEWQVDTSQKLLVLNNGYLRQRIDLLFNKKRNAEAHIKKGLNFIKNIKGKEQSLFRNVQQIIEKLSYHVKNQKYQQPFSLVKLQKQVNFPQSNLKINSSKTMKSLLSEEKDENLIYSSANFVPLEPRKSTQNRETFSTINLQPSGNYNKVQSPRINRGLSNHKTFSSIFKNNNKTPIVFKQKVLSRVSSASKIKNSLKSKVSKFKSTHNFQKVIDGVINDNLEIVDLTNASLQDEQIKQILQYIQEKPKSIKLARNKLTDQGFIKIVPYLKNICVLNLSSNSLTDTIINIINENLNSLCSLKSIVLSQNKIMERKHKQTIQKWRKSGIAVSI